MRAGTQQIVILMINILYELIVLFIVFLLSFSEAKYNLLATMDM